MPIELKEFQERAIDELFDAVERGEESIVLRSCTGSGKTIILTHFAERVMRQFRNVATVWFTPGKGDLEMQSKAKMDRYVHGAVTKTLSDAITSGFESGDACFVNWELLNKKNSTAMRESERLNLIDRVEEAHDAGTVFLMVIDEGHVNDTPKAAAIIKLFNPKWTVRASATPTRKLTDAYVEVPEDDVIEQGLIKKAIIINPDLEFDAAIENEVGYLLDQANVKRLSVVNAYRRLERDINPLVVVQLPDADDELRAQVEAKLESMGKSYENSKAAVWLSEEKRNIEGIEKLDAPQEFVIIKQAIAVGWDCPRAHILVKLRENMTEVFQIQTIGRIRRMPEAMHYGSDVLDNCYIYTFDTRFIEDTKAAAGGRAYESKTLSLKPEYRKFKLTSEQRDAQTMEVDPRRAFEAIRAYLVQEMNLKDRALNKAIMQRRGYQFMRRLKDETQTGAVQHASEEEIRALETVGVTIKASTRNFHDACNNKLYKIAQSTGIEYSQLGKIMRRLFLEKSSDKKKERTEKLLELDQVDYYAFIANNDDLIKDAVRQAMAQVGLMAQMQENLQMRERTFLIPPEYEMRYDAEEADQSMMQKNVYAGYRVSSKPRSEGERLFERFCEDSPHVKWFYKNGDKGSEYFSVMYLDNLGREPLFYPDYIVEDHEGTVWIIEAKGGQKKSGQSENIDRYAPKKFEALRSYVERHPGLKMGFVRYDKKILQLRIATRIYSEDLDDQDLLGPRWQLLRDVL